MICCLDEFLGRFYLIIFFLVCFLYRLVVMVVSCVLSEVVIVGFYISFGVLLFCFKVVIIVFFGLLCIVEINLFGRNCVIVMVI